MSSSMARMMATSVPAGLWLDPPVDQLLNHQRV
jgi:hypothetical protein